MMATDSGVGSHPQLVQIAVTGLMDTHPSDNIESGSDVEDDGCDTPSLKRQRIDYDYHLNTDSSVKQILFNINKAICIRLDSIENTLSSLSNRTRDLDNKMEHLTNLIKQNTGVSPNQVKKGAVIVGLPQQNGNKSGGDASDLMSDASALGSMDALQSLGPNVTLITLNNEEDFPSGTWLGDETNPEMRVRVNISPSDLLHIHSNCRTPEKMALTMLDYLFDRETQASSNLSGMGKHGKKQLDPLMIYGIRCHLIHRFGITENDWHRIKQNIDSKCRTAFRRKQRGMPLTVKAFRGKTTPSYLSPNDIQHSDDDSMNPDDSELHIQHVNSDLDIQQAVAMHGDGISSGEIQILHATPEQISQLQQAQHIQILQGDHVIQVPVPQHIHQLQASDLPDGVQVAVSLPSVESLQMTVDTGDGSQIQHQEQ